MTEPATTTETAPPAAPAAPATPADMGAAMLAALGQKDRTFIPPTPVQPDAPEATGDAPDKAEKPSKDSKDAKAEQRLEDLPSWAREAIKKANQEAAGYRTKAKELEPLADIGRQLEAASKTELQRHEEARTSAERERDELRVQVARMSAAATHSIPPELVDLLGSGTSEEITARAELLAEKLKALTPAPAPVAPTPPARPVESLRPGAAPGDSGQKKSVDDWLRAMTGRT